MYMLSIQRNSLQKLAKNNVHALATSVFRYSLRLPRRKLEIKGREIDFRQGRGRQFLFNENSSTFYECFW
jgi:hypothetical protein